MRLPDRAYGKRMASVPQAYCICAAHVWQTARHKVDPRQSKVAGTWRATGARIPKRPMDGLIIGGPIWT